MKKVALFAALATFLPVAAAQHGFALVSATNHTTGGSKIFAVTGARHAEEAQAIAMDACIKAPNLGRCILETSGNHPGTLVTAGFKPTPQGTDGRFLWYTSRTHTVNEIVAFAQEQCVMHFKKQCDAINVHPL